MRYWWLLIIAACTPPPKYAPTVSTNQPLAAKPATCEFRVVNLPPTPGDFEEIASLTPQPGQVAYTPEVFKQSVQADVCKLGGDLVVTEINGAGAYVRGTVLRARAAAAATQ